MAMTLTAKLQIKPGWTMTLINAPEGYHRQLASALQGVVLTGKNLADSVLVFAGNLSEARSLAPKAFGTVRMGGVVWIAYPKGNSGVKTDIKRDSLVEVLKPTGWRPVRQIALDDIWSAVRYRPEGEVGKKA